VPAQALTLAREAVDLGLTSPQDVCACEFALAIALEANRQVEPALTLWQECAAKTPFIEHRREAELAIARLQGDRRRGLELLEWFEQRGLGAMVLQARRDFLTEEIEVLQPSFTTARIEVLGAIRLFRNDQPVITRAHKRLEILTYLLETRISGRIEATTRELAFALYPNMPEADAKKALKQLIYLNRAVLGVDSLVSTPGGYALGAISSDAEDFLQTGDSLLWRGVYQGSLEDNWLLGVRNALTSSLQTSIELLLESNPNEAARLGLILLEMEPYDAKVLRLSLNCLKRSGNLKRAHTIYAEGCSKLLEVGELLPETMDGFLRPQMTV
jgi:DNA-binding SARP family transcriptional activator